MKKSSPNSSLSPRLLITGGCGFIGLNFIDFMLKKGFTNFRILDNLSVGQIEDLENLLSEHGPYEKNEEGDRVSYSLSSLLTPDSSPKKSASPLTPNSSLKSIELLIGDIRDPKDCNKATKNVDAIVHLAAQSGVPTSVEDPLHDCETNVIGTLNILEACRENNVDKFIFASSGAPLGEVDPPIHEKKLPRPISPYGASKLAGEAYCHAYYKTFAIKTVVLRFGNVYGPRSSHKTSVVAKFFKRALEGKPLEIYGNGSQTRDFIYVEDLCNAILLALNKLSPQPSVLSTKNKSSTLSTQSSSGAGASMSSDPNSDVTPNSLLLSSDSTVDSLPLTPHSQNGVAGEIFQIATFKETTVNGIAEKIKDLVNSGDGGKVQIIYGKNKRIGDVERNFSDISKATDLLGFLPQYHLEKGLKETWQFFNQHGVGALEPGTRSGRGI